MKCVFFILSIIFDRNIINCIFVREYQYFTLIDKFRLINIDNIQILLGEYSSKVCYICFLYLIFLIWMNFIEQLDRHKIVQAPVCGISLYNQNSGL